MRKPRQRSRFLLLPRRRLALPPGNLIRALVRALVRAVARAVVPALVPVLACWAALTGCAREPQERPPRTDLATRGYILISLDTLRADHLGAYGYARDTSPFLDRLAARGVLFENAVVPLPGTLPSHMSIFTGLYPPEHGVYPPDRVLSQEIETLPEAFRRHGFRTAGFTEGGYMSGHYGFARGFDHFSDGFEGTARDVERTLARGLDFLAGLEPDDRFFLFLHTYATHDPYEPPPPYRSQFWPGPPPADTFVPNGVNLEAVNQGKASVTAEQVEYFEALYDGGIRYVDAVLEQWFARLDALGLLENTTIVITSDHGEEFLEHGRLVHEQPYHETLHVPLIVLHPAAAGGHRVPVLVRSIDLAPTLHELARLQPAGRFSGESLVPLLVGDPGAPERAQERAPERTPRRQAPGPVPVVREAYAESFDRSVRTLYRQAEGELAHLLWTLPPQEPHGSWVSGAVSFDTSQRQLVFRAMSFHQDRQLVVTADGEPVRTLDLAPAWQTVRLDLPGGGARKRIEIRADGCTSPAAVGLNEDTRCLSFLVDGLDLGRSELFLPLDDPLEQNDLSTERPELHRRLATRLRALHFEEQAPAGASALSAEQEERLKSLGYLQ